MGSFKSTRRSDSQGILRQPEHNAAASDPALQAVLQETIVEVNRMTALLLTHGARLHGIHQRITTLRNDIENRRQAATGPDANDYRAILNQIKLDMRVQIGRDLDSDEQNRDEGNRIVRL